MTRSPRERLLAHIRDTRDAHTQDTYQRAAAAFFAELDALDAYLARARFLNGAEPDADDWQLLDVLLDVVLVYYALYKLNRTRVLDMPNVGQYVLDLYQLRESELGPADLEALLDERVRDAWVSDARHNPKGVVPVGRPDFGAPHDRLKFDRESRTTLAQEEDQGQKLARRARGEFVRGVSAHRRFIGRDLPAEAGRYHLIIANNCPWCHRAALARSMKSLDNTIGVGVLYYRRDAEKGWQFAPEAPGFEADALYGHRWVQDYYRSVGSTETSVPLLWDKQLEQVVNNESSEIVRMLDEAWPDRGIRLAPPALLDEIERYNAWIYRDINNGAYKAGFSSSQAVYERAFKRFFAAFERLDRLLADRQYLCGDVPTEADLRLYPTVFRFDPVYYVRMKLNHRMVRDYPHLSRWLSDFGALPGVAEASNIEHCRAGYFGRTADGFIPIGPQ